MMKLKNGSALLKETVSFTKLLLIGLLSLPAFAWAGDAPPAVDTGTPRGCSRALRSSC